MSAKLKLLITAVIALGMAGCASAEELNISGEFPEIGTELPAAPHFGFAADEEAEKLKLENARAMSEKFMNGLRDHDTDVLMQYGGAQSFGAYNFLDGVNLTDWEIIDSVVHEHESAVSRDDNIVTYKIKLSVSESGCDSFPEGESVWELDVIDSDKSYFSSFRHEGESVDNIIADRVVNIDRSDAVKMAYAYTSEFGWMRRNGKLFDMDSTKKPMKMECFINNLIEFCRFFNETDDMLAEDNLYSADWLSESAYKLLGLKDIDIASCPNYDAGNNTVKHTRAGYYFGYSSFVSEEYDADKGLYKIVLDWYADTIFLAKASTFDYTLADNGDGTLKLISVEKTYDSGEKPIFFFENIDRDGW